MLLVTQDYLNEIYQDIEQPLSQLAKERELRILWIYVRYCDWKDCKEIEKYVPLYDPDKPLSSFDKAEQERVFVEILKKIKEVLGV